MTPPPSFSFYQEYDPFSSLLDHKKRDILYLKYTPFSLDSVVIFIRFIKILGLPALPFSVHNTRKCTAPHAPRLQRNGGVDLLP